MSLPLVTRRLLLRRFEAGDAAGIHEVWSDPAVGAALPGGTPGTLEDTHALLTRIQQIYGEHDCGPLAVVERAGGSIVGDSGVFVNREGSGELELAYRIKKDRWGLGYATEAALACVGYGLKDLGASRIVADVDPGNDASRRVLVKCGLKLVGPGFEDGHQVLLYALERPR